MSPHKKIIKIVAKLSLLLAGLLPILGYALDNDQQQIMHVRAKIIEYYKYQHRAIYLHHVVASQGSMHIQADKVVVFNDPRNNHINKLVAYGKPAHYNVLPKADGKRLYAEANTIEYFPLTHRVLLLKNAKVTQQGNIFTGQHISYNILKQTVISTAPGQQGTTTLVIKPNHKG